MPKSPVIQQLSVRLQTSPEQTERLRRLQAEFAQACNALSPLAQSTACWNRVALHHMAYRQLRQQFPQLGSQMVCNVVYSVSRACRHVYQEPASPFNLQRLGGRPLPLLRFSPQSPVYFDRHTLSVKDGQASIYTLDGRMRFRMSLAPADESRFKTEKLREIVLVRRVGHFLLQFGFDPVAASADADADTAPERGIPAGGPPVAGRLPRYIVIVRAPRVRTEGIAPANAAVPAPKSPGLPPLLGAQPQPEPGLLP